MVYEWLRKHEKIFFFAQIIYRVLKKDFNFINAVINWGNDPDFIRIVHRGRKNTGKIVYVITEQGHGYGFFAEFKALLEKLVFAEMHGFIPYISFGENYLYYDESLLSEKNAFKYYFKERKEVVYPLESENVVFSRGCDCEYVERRFNSLGYSESQEFEHQLVYVLKKYIIINLR